MDVSKLFGTFGPKHVHRDQHLGRGLRSRSLLRRRTWECNYNRNRRKVHGLEAMQLGVPDLDDKRCGERRRLYAAAPDRGDGGRWGRWGPLGERRRGEGDG